jgi:MFS family permease
MTGSLAIWSGFTALSGLSGNYMQLLLFRLGVGVGEAGGSPPAHAILSDLYEKEKRGRALSIYSAGLYIGTMTGYIAGGWLSDSFDWRTAFFVVGIPGVVLAVFIWLTMREPLRGLSGIKPTTTNVTFLGSFKKLWQLKAFRFYSFATGAGTFVTYGVGNWMVPYLERSHGWERTDIGLMYGLAAGIFGAVGTIGGGYLADRLGAKDRRWFLWVPMWGKIIAGPFFVIGLLAPNGWIALGGYSLGLICASVYLGPSLAITHHLVPPSMRAMSSAVLFFILNMLGLGLGPLLVGYLSDYLTNNTDLAQDSLRWAMAAAVLSMYPLTILWHWGAQALPKGELDDDGNALQEAVTEGDPAATKA